MYRLPAEWEAQSTIQLTWPHAATDWNYCLDDITRTYVELADAITRDESLLIVAPDTENIRQLLCEKLSAEQNERISYCECLTNDTWARDHGFITLLDETNEPVLLDFQFNGWGKKFPAQLDNAINRHIFCAGAIGNHVEIHDNFVLEGDRSSS